MTVTKMVLALMVAMLTIRMVKKPKKRLGLLEMGLVMLMTKVERIRKVALFGNTII